MNTRLNLDKNFIISKQVIASFIVDAEALGQHSFITTICNLMREAEREINRIISNPVDITIVSLGTRNIIELYLISRHIYTETKWEENWWGQMHKDSIDIQEGLVSLLEKHNKDPSEVKNYIEFCDQSLEESQFESKGGFNIRDLAKRYGHDEDYISVHKLCSKLIHPTSIKINAYQAFTENDNYIKTLSYVAVYFAHNIELLTNEIREKLFA